MANLIMPVVLPRALLRLLAALALVAGIVVWAATGASRQVWHTTERTTYVLDEVTGIEAPVIEQRFTAGLDVVAAGVVVAGLLAGLSLLPRRRPTVPPA